MPDNDGQRCSDVDALVASAHTDREAFGRLYEAYYDRIFRYCLRRLLARCTAEDVVSDVFLFVARNMRTFPGTTEQDFRRWVYRIATTEINAYLRRMRRRTRLWDGVVLLKLAAADDARRLETWEESAWPAVHQAIARLTAKEQSILTLRLFENMSHNEIAQVMNMGESAARTAYSRALQKLRDLLSSARGRSTDPAAPRA